MKKRMKTGRTLMKTINFKALVMSVALPILGSLMFLACGGGGGEPSSINLQNNIPPEAVELVYPANGATDVCTYPTFKIHVKNKDYCQNLNMSDLIGIIPQGQNKSVGTTVALPIPTSDGGCDFSFNAKAALAPLATVQWGVLGSSSSTVSTLQSKFASFTTSQNGSCPGDAARFILVRSNVASVLKPLGDIGDFGTLNQDGSFNANFNLNSAYQFVAASYLYAPLVALIGTPIGARQDIVLTFNEAPNMITVPGSIRVTTANLFGFGGSEESVNTSVIAGPDANSITIKAPPEGYLAGTFAASINKSIISSSGRTLSATGTNGPSSYILIFKSSGM